MSIWALIRMAYTSGSTNICEDTMGWAILKFAVPAIIIVLIAGALMTKKTFHVEQFIEATPEEIWEVLMDTSTYPEWNPVFVQVEGVYAEGAKMLNKVKAPQGDLLEMSATVKTLRTTRELRQTGGLPGIITFDHQWLLEPVEGGTILTQREVDRGLYLWFWDSSWIEPAYQRVNEALKHEVTKNK